MLSRILTGNDRPLVTFGKGVMLLWIVISVGCFKMPEPPDDGYEVAKIKTTPVKEAPVSTKPELVPGKSDPITPKIPLVPPRNARVRELQEERLKVLQELVKSVELEFEVGNLSLEDVWKSRENLLEAQLEFCETKADRIRVHQELVEVVESLHNRVQELFRRGRGGENSKFLSTRANLLKAQIALEKEKSSPE